MNKKKMMIISVVLFSVASLLASCVHYTPPEGYSKKHHSYEEMVEYAKTLDPQAVVTDGYTDAEEEYNEFRIWPAVINGIECGVASESAVVSNDGFYPGEFPGRFYRFDTDYYYYILRGALDAHPELGEIDDSVAMRFRYNDIFASKVYVQSITEGELDTLWESYREVIGVLEQESVPKTYWCVISFPDGKFFNIMSVEGEDLASLKDTMEQRGYLLR